MTDVDGVFDMECIFYVCIQATRHMWPEIWFSYCVIDSSCTRVTDYHEDKFQTQYMSYQDRRTVVCIVASIRANCKRATAVVACNEATFRIWEDTAQQLTLCPLRTSTKVVVVGGKYNKKMWEDLVSVETNVESRPSSFGSLMSRFFVRPETGSCTSFYSYMLYRSV